MKFEHKGLSLILSLMLLVGFVAFQATIGPPTTQADTSTQPEAAPSTVADLMRKMEEKEYALYENALRTTIQIRLAYYQQYIGQKTNSPWELSPTITLLSRKVVDFYCKILLLRIETILEIKRRWPDQSVDDLIDMLQYHPDLILAIMDEIDRMVSLEGLNLNLNQKKSVSTNWLHRDIQRMEKSHQIYTILLDLKSALTTQLPKTSWVADQIANIATLQDEIIDFRKQIHEETWDLLSPDQRETYLHLIYVAIRNQ